MRPELRPSLLIATTSPVLMDREHWTVHSVSFPQTWGQEIRDAAAQLSAPDQAKQTGDKAGISFTGKVTRHSCCGHCTEEHKAPRQKAVKCYFLQRYRDSPLETGGDSPSTHPKPSGL